MKLENCIGKNTPLNFPLIGKSNKNLNWFSHVLLNLSPISTSWVLYFIGNSLGKNTPWIFLFPNFFISFSSKVPAGIEIVLCKNGITVSHNLSATEWGDWFVLSTNIFLVLRFKNWYKFSVLIGDIHYFIAWFYFWECSILIVQLILFSISSKWDEFSFVVIFWIA